MNNARIAKDIASLFRAPPPDIVLPAEGPGSLLHDISVYVRGPEETPYYGGYYKLTLKLPADYPQSAPRATFITKIFHPNVNYSSGDVCVDTLKKTWSTEISICDVLSIIRCLLIEPNPESALNEDAGKLLLEDFESFEKTARLMNKVHSLKEVEGSTEKGDKEAGGVLRDLGDGLNIIGEPGVKKVKPKKKRTGLKRL
ncbi:hypothetical protein BABINDRAFT_161067 [Babjeviella inositovora NRRL Y-12698]|uniref:UBC core domain-containing protein n=1 Tax=Babjeviella inositovora NRRL Y-12698 TaxID=984486 RepID=A0A1E3QTK2_9ASCO|nr:uncharacterized protein BABINDRAFT_161067 [Babjeviella inositovora NRRL Y-12698]ODQ80874.1 hypothetical protein BABINDRAFT_161067 [Babjeviella inositovora NRRL Y-12698]